MRYLKEGILKWLRFEGLKTQLVNLIDVKHMHVWVSGGCRSTQFIPFQLTIIVCISMVVTCLAASYSPGMRKVEASMYCTRSSGGGFVYIYSARHIINK